MVCEHWKKTALVDPMGTETQIERRIHCYTYSVGHVSKDISITRSVDGAN